MPLDKQIVEIPLVAGIDTKTESKLQRPPYLSILENGVHTKVGTIKKRAGGELLGNMIQEGGTLSSTDGLAAFNDELLQYSAGKIYSYLPSTDKWTLRGNVNPVVIKKKEVLRNSYTQTLPDVAYTSGVFLFVWKDSRGGVRASVYDETSFTALQFDVSLSATGTYPRAAVIGGNLFGFWVESQTLKCKYINPIAPQTFSAEISIAADLVAANPNYDVTQLSQNAVFAYNGPTGKITVGYIDKLGLVGTATRGLPDPVAISSVTATSSIAIAAQSGQINNLIFIAHSNTGSGTSGLIRNQDLTSSVASAVLDSYISTAVTNIAAIWDSTNARIVYEQSNATAINTLVKKAGMTSAGAPIASSTVKRSVGLSSKMLSYGGSLYFVTVFPSTTQATYFLLDTSGNVHGRIVSQNAGGLGATPGLSNIMSLSDSTAAMAILQKGNLESESGVIFGPTGVVCANLDFDARELYLNAQLGDNLHTVGAAGIVDYDGASTFEHGFWLYPEGIVATPGTVGSGGMDDGVYSYKVMWEWIDNRGQTHRSAPSIAISATTVGGAGKGKVTLTIPTLRLTMKTAPRAEVSVVIYRTIATGTVYYRASSISSPTFNDTTADTISYVDQLSDSLITSNELLYTTGGVLENSSPPACSLIAAGKTRLFIAGLEDPYTIWYSKEHVDGEPVNFSDLQTIRINPTGGEIKGVVCMDEKTVIFTDRGYFFFSGEGPNDLGQDDNYTLPAQFIPTGVGLSDSTSISLYDQGILFKATTGIHLLDRALNTTYVGKEVEDYNSYSITSSKVLSDAKEIRFTLSGGPTLVYNYFSQQWGTFVPGLGEDAEIWQGSYVWVRSDGSVMQETPGVFLDDSQAFPLRIGTSWIRFAGAQGQQIGIQGFQRVWKLLFLGKFKSNHKLLIQFCYDYSDLIQNEITWDAKTELGSYMYGSGTTYGYGDGPFYGSLDNEVYQVRVSVPRQKCEALKVIIQDVLEEGTMEGFELSHIQAEVGVKKPVYRLKSGKSV